MKKELKSIVESKKRQIAKKGQDMSNLDLYNLCVLNKFDEALSEDADREMLGDDSIFFDGDIGNK